MAAVDRSCELDNFTSYQGAHDAREERYCCRSTQTVIFARKKQQLIETSKTLSDSLGECPPKGDSFDAPSPWDYRARCALRLDEPSTDIPLAQEDEIKSSSAKHGITYFRSDELSPREIALRNAFSESLRRAFDTFKLDPSDPFDWRTLLNHFAFVEFGKRPKKKPGRPLMNTPDTFAELLKERERIIKKYKSPKMSNERVAELLANDKSTRFFQLGRNSAAGGDPSKVGIEGLRKAIGLALRLQPKNSPQPFGTK